MNAPHFCGLLPPPERKDALAAVARTIGLVRRRHGLAAVDIARALKNERGEPVHEDTISRAERGENLLSFDLICQIAYIYGDCADPIRRLLEPAPTAEPTSLDDRLQLAENEILTVRRELEAMRQREGGE